MVTEVTTNIVISINTTQTTGGNRMLYSEVFKNLNKKTIEVTRLLPKDGIWKKDVSTEEKILICEKWLKSVSEIYEVEVPKFRFSNSQSGYFTSGGGIYSSETACITLYKKFSIVTLLHEFRHHMQYQNSIRMYRGEQEEDARAWSLSLYKSALPKSYQNSVDKRNLHFY